MQMYTHFRNTRTTKHNVEKRWFYEYWKYKYLTLMFVPAIIYYIIFHYIPIYGIQIAFKSYRFDLGIWGSPWIGFENFKTLLHTGSFWEVLRNTLTISFYKLLIGFPAPVIFALFLNEINHTSLKKTVQTISYLPHFMSWVVLGGLFAQFLSPSIGPINLFLKSIGINPIYFLADPKWFRFVLVTTSVWKGIGWGSVIYLASISSINTEMYEAAIVEGANRFHRAIYVTIPSLAPVITIMLIFSIGGLINDDFDQIFNLYNPAVYSVGDVLSTYSYRMGLVNMEYSFSTAVGLFKNIISFILIIMANKIANKINDYGIW